MIIFLGFYLLQQIPTLLMSLSIVNKNKTLQTGYLIAIIAAMILVPFFMIRYYNKINNDYHNRFTIKTVGIILLAFIAEILVNQATLPFMKQTGNANVDALSNIFNGFPLLMLFYATILGPILEEMLFRGFFMNMFFVETPYISLVLSSILFGIMHTSDDPIYFISKVILGFVLGFVYLKTKNIKANIITHMLNNFSAFIKIW